MADVAEAQRETRMMSDMPAFVQFMRQPSTLTELQDGPAAFGSKVMQPLIKHMQSRATFQEINSTLHDLVPVMREADSFHAAMLAILCGSLVEKGGEPSILADVVAHRLMQQLRDLHGYLEAHGTAASVADMFNQGFQDAARAQASTDHTFLVAAAMAMLCRDVKARIAWRSNHPDGLELLTELDDADKIPYFLKRVFTLVDERDLFVVDGVNRRVFQARLTGVQGTLYHCFALLQDALLRYVGAGYLDALPTDSACVRYAQNDNLSGQEQRSGASLIEEPRFDFCYPGGLFVPGSMTLWDLPRSGETPLLVIAKKGTLRSPQQQWSPSNAYPVLHQALRSCVDIVQELPGNEAEAVLQVTQA